MTSLADLGRRGPLVVGVLFLATLVACGDDDGDDDPDAGGVDAGVDAGPDGGIDGGPTCDGECLGVEVCCAEAPGSSVGECVDVRRDPNHCGACGEVCDESFTECVDGRCVCGATSCIPPNVCCPGATDPDERVCRSILTDRRHCGACNEACDEAVANLCLDGECVCGTEGRPCDPEKNETCCRDPDIPGGARCANLDEDDEFCGACEKPEDAHDCRKGARCVDGLCTVGEPVCEEGCAFPSFICCFGGCCLEERCSPDGCV